jgi:3,4-dihydroxy-2-butanone 4-phosphate synthase
MNNHILLAYNSLTVGVVCSTMTVQKLEKLGVKVIVFEKVKQKPVSFRVVCDKYLSMYTGIDYKTLKAMASVAE